MIAPLCSSFFFYCYAAPRTLHSFPTRRSSDLHRDQGAPAGLRRSMHLGVEMAVGGIGRIAQQQPQLAPAPRREDRKSTRLNSSHVAISYAVFCLKKKKRTKDAYVHNV